MLQQTQVAVVIPYFARFLSRFPSLSELAQAEEQDVLRLWEGLGYYRRARDLLAAARILVRDYQGQFPADPEQLGQLPGFGTYTTHAVLSQAFDLRLPILEANSQRLLSRLFGRQEDPRQGVARRWLWQAAETLLPVHRAGDFNQALMEVGALLCTPRAPACDQCPLADRCVARKHGNPEAFPSRTATQEPIPIREAAVVIRRGDEVLLVQRPATASRWANLWEFPHGPLEEGESVETGAIRIATSTTGLAIDLGSEILTLRHGVTRYRITMICFEACYSSGRFASDFYGAARWLKADELASFPVSAAQRRLARELLRPDRQKRLF